MDKKDRLTEKVTDTVKKTKKQLTQILAEIARIATIPAITSLVAMVLFRFFGKNIYLKQMDFLVAVLALTIIPALSYPASLVIPSCRKEKRAGQRKLAMYFSVAGYLVGFIYAWVSTTEPRYKIIMCSYIMSVILLLICNRLLGFKASGHACSTVGPALCIAIYCGGVWGLVSLMMILLVVWSSLRLGRHKLSELTVGGAISTFSIVILMLI